MSRVPPVARLLALIIIVVATFIDPYLAFLAAAIVILAFFLATDGLLWKYLKFLLVVQLPMTVMLVAVWGWMAAAPPGKPMGSDPRGGVIFAFLISLRLAVLCGAFQLAMLSIPSQLLPATLRGWGLRGEGLVVALGVFAVEPEFKIRAEQIIVARRARGMLGGSRWAGFKQLPYLLRPLFVWSIRSAVHRADVWEQRAMLLRVQKLPAREKTEPFSMLAGVAAFCFSFLWLVVVILVHWFPLRGIV